MPADLSALLDQLKETRLGGLARIWLREEEFDALTDVAEAAERDPQPMPRTLEALARLRSVLAGEEYGET